MFLSNDKGLIKEISNNIFLNEYILNDEIVRNNLEIINSYDNLNTIINYLNNHDSIKGYTLLYDENIGIIVHRNIDSYIRIPNVLKNICKPYKMFMLSEEEKFIKKYIIGDSKTKWLSPEDQKGIDVYDKVNRLYKEYLNHV